MQMSYNKAVARLQNYLLAAGIDLPQYGADGSFGAETSHAIGELDAPDFVKIALKEVGIYEIKGDLHHPRVLEYHKTTAGRYGTDEVPWCGSFVNWVMLKAKYQTVAYPERAKAWLEFGRPVGEPVLGAIAIKSRKGGGHVNIVVGMNYVGQLWCVGGNQNDEVNLSLYDQEVFEDFRVPREYDLSYELPIFDGRAVGGVRES